MDSTLYYDPEESGDGEGAQLGVYVHHARGIQNICIYASQDVYAKLSLTRSPDEAVSTRVAAGGGANPRFDELLAVGRVASPRSAVLKCEIWMLSRARSLLDDQLLGFALVPLSSVAAAAARSLTQDFSLSSTDLFHSPAGTVRLSLSLSLDHPPPPAPAAAAGTASSSAGITSEVVILDYRRLEPPDVAVEEENRRMVAEYFDIMSPTSTATRPSSSSAAPPPSFLRLDSDYDMTSSDSPDDGPPSFASSAATASLSDESKKITADSSSSSSSSSSSNSSSAAEAVGTPTSKPGAVESGGSSSKLENDSSKEDRKAGAELGSVFESPMGNISLEAEQAAMQQQIVEMYMKSMQQFTESLAKMKLPMDLDNPRPGDDDDDRRAVIQSQSNDTNNNDTKLDVEEKNKKKDGSRVFYGSRAFF